MGKKQVQNPLNIEHLKIEAITPYAHNPKTHPPEQIEKLARVIERFGFRVPVLVDEKNVLIAGHGRLLAAQKLELKTIPAIRAKGLTPDQVKEYRIADNKLAELSTWDYTAMAHDFTLAELETLAPDMGLSETDLEAFMDAAALTPEEARAAADQAARDGRFDQNMTGPVNPKMAIVPQYLETYEAFIIVCQNQIDEVFMREALGLEELQKSYIDKKVRRANILTVEQFKEKWESR